MCAASGGYPGAVETGTVSGAISEAFTWSPSYSGEPTPQSVIVANTCRVQIASGTGPYNDDAGHQGSGRGIDVTGTKYTVQSSPGSSFTASGVTNPSATATGNASLAIINVTATAKPLTISVGGATVNPADGSLNILIGQRCAPTLAGVPAGLTVSNYTWTVDGTTFQTWSPTTPAVGTKPADPNASYFVDGPGPLTVAAPSWYWNVSGRSGSKQSETITCTATVTPPTGQGSAFTVTASQKINVYIPNWSAFAVGGSMQVGGILKPDKSLDYYMRAAPTAVEFQNGFGRGMTWQATIKPIPNINFGTGQMEIVQIYTSHNSYSTNTTPPHIHDDVNYGKTGLDTYCPYASVVPDTQSLIQGDSPGLELTSNVLSATHKSSFTTYLMYQPANSSQFVPLASLDWNTNGTATIPASNDWGKFTSNPVGTVVPNKFDSTATPPGISITATNRFPNWTQILTAQAF